MHVAVRVLNSSAFISSVVTIHNIAIEKSVINQVLPSLQAI